ncbi:MAG: DUF3667 domain-containing protein [Bernardetiaceae bacterium]|nr:DUF3667 domain-containing protein [Bernardetiaceae bacterium]
MNCHTEISKDAHFCSHCGQKIVDYNVSFKNLIQDFMGNVFNLDSQFFRTAPSLILKPGLLTLAFIEGKRKRYIHPIRLYLACSVLFFFVFLKVQIPAWEQAVQKANFNFETNDEDNESSTPFIEINKELKKDSIDSQELDKFVQAGVDTKSQMDKVLTWLQTPGFTADQLLDSLEVGKNERNFLMRKTASQMLKIGRNDLNLFIIDTVNNLPFIMLLALPFLALLLKLLYIRRNKFFITHFIFVLHLQSFIFVCLVFIMVLSLAGLYWLSGFLFFIGIFTYLFLAFKKVYKQSYLLTFIKAQLWYFSYLGLVVVLLTLNMIISIFTF